MGQDFVKNSPSSVDSLNSLELNSSMLNLDIRSKVLSSEVSRCLSTNNTLDPSAEELLVQEAQKIQCVNQTFSTSTSNNKDFSSEENNLIRGRRDRLQRESLRFMKGVMDECTHVANFSGTSSNRRSETALLVFLMPTLAACNSNLYKQFLFKYSFLLCLVIPFECTRLLNMQLFLCYTLTFIYFSLVCLVGSGM